jgi:hypothetical protein
VSTTPNAFIFEGDVVEHSERGRALIRNVDFAGDRYVVEFEDRTTLEPSRPKRA